ncbi:Uu.00g133700.m01.CDS01 [Anthostomella pinea]|uniref:Uu.00g133700.m01.CDS01 n=1 Tax=Anthostomella pinea TaxID=933095 RepID=A0AAI8VNV6_9PEZI|nr:Uu.00g133700.m01.CDS01 [Anthostomella pinea]
MRQPLFTAPAPAPTPAPTPTPTPSPTPSKSPKKPPPLPPTSPRGNTISSPKTHVTYPVRDLLKVSNHPPAAFDDLAILRPGWVRYWAWSGPYNGLGYSL